jgi:hypothetical protein
MGWDGMGWMGWDGWMDGKPGPGLELDAGTMGTMAKLGTLRTEHGTLGKNLETLVLDLELEPWTWTWTWNLNLGLGT